jgi:hypothetical protein
MDDHLRYALLALAFCGCAPDLTLGDDSRYLDASAQHEDATLDGALPPQGGPHVTHTLTEQGLLTRINAQSAEDWVYLDLDTGLEITPATADNDPTWDIAFRRSNVATNGGITGTGGVTVASSSAPFSDVTTAPDTGFVTDLADGDDEDTLPDYAFRFWYLYDESTHVLTPDAITYVVRTTTGAFVKLRLAGYYDHVGTSGSPSFHSERLP